MNRKTRKAIVIFLIMVFTIVSLSTIITVPISFKVIRTDFKLFLVSLNVQLVENDARNAKPGYGWPENRVEYYESLMKQREDLYHSDDVVVRTVATSNNFMRFLYVILIIFVAAIQFVAFKYAIYFCIQLYYQKQRQKQCQKRRQKR